MLKVVLISLMSLVLFSCQQSSTTSLYSEQYQDTIYSKSASSSPNFKRPIIKLSNDSISDKEFKLVYGEKNYLRLTVDNFTNKYPVYLLNPENLVIEEINKKTGDFYLTPTDSVCTFEVHLDFGINNVLVAYSTDSVGLVYNSYDSIRALGRVVEEVIMPN